MELTIPIETVCRVIVQARALEAGLADTDSDNEEAVDADDLYAVIEEEADTSDEDEVRALLEDLADNEIAVMLALAMVGRGTYDASEWDEALEEAESSGGDAVEHLLDMPMLAAYLDAGLSAFDLSCDGVGTAD